MAGLIDPVEAGFTITPSDDDDLTRVVRAIYVGTGGDLKVEMINQDIVTFVNVPDGTLLPIQVKKVFDTDTDAEDLLGLY